MENNSSAPSAPVDSSSNEVSTESQDQSQPQSNSEQLAQAREVKKIKSLKLKVDGQEYEENLPFEVDESSKEQIEYLKRHLQMSKAAGKRMSEAAQVKKQTEQFIQKLKENPVEVLSNPQLMGEDKFREIAEQYLMKHIQNQMLTPEQRKQMEMEQELQKYKQKEEQSRKEQEETQLKAMEEHYQAKFQKTIIEALEASQLPKNPFTVKRMAKLMQKNLKHGLDLEPQHLAQIVREDYQSELKSLIGAASPEQLLSMFGEDVATKIRKHDLEKMKTQNPFQARPQTESKPQPQHQEEEIKLRPHEFEEMLNKRLGTKR